MEIQELFCLDGKVAVITGGAGAYGFHISSALCEAGATSVIASRSVEDCEKAVKVLSCRGFKAVARHLDLSSEESIIGCISSVIESFGHIDILVNASVLRSGINLEDMTCRQWEEAQKVNSTGLMLICKETVKHMRERGCGSIINISSIQGAVGPNFEVYGSTGMSSPVNYTYDKWGMVGLTKWMANYYGKHNIRVNCISPGGFNPALMRDESKREFVENYKRLTPLGRFAVEDDIKGPIVFLASDASKFMTGHNLMVDGGWTSW